MEIGSGNKMECCFNAAVSFGSVGMENVGREQISTEMAKDV
jgi:hypothetical protein